MTLVELLVVISLIVLVSAITIPMFNSGADQRKMREAARLLDTFLQGARDRAQRLGRPVGVIFERDMAATRRNASRVMRVAEAGQPFAGEAVNSAVIISNWTATSSTVGASAAAAPTVNWNSATSPIRVGDLVRFNNQGAFFIITATDTGSFTFGVGGDAARASEASPAFSLGVPFQVLPSPRASTAEPLILQEGTVVDLQYSGTTLIGNLAQASNSDTAPIILTFSPHGSMDRLYYTYWNGTAATATTLRLTEPIHFLVGRSGKVETQDNLVDVGNFWVSVYPMTGRVKTDENAIIDSSASTAAERLQSARRYARSAINAVE